MPAIFVICTFVSSLLTANSGCPEAVYLEALKKVPHGSVEARSLDLAKLNDVRAPLLLAVRAYGIESPETRYRVWLHFAASSSLAIRQPNLSHSNWSFVQSLLEASNARNGLPQLLHTLQNTAVRDLPPFPSPQERFDAYLRLRDLIPEPSSARISGPEQVQIARAIVVMLESYGPVTRQMLLGFRELLRRELNSENLEVDAEKSASEAILNLLVYVNAKLKIRALVHSIKSQPPFEY